MSSIPWELRFIPVDGHSRVIHVNKDGSAIDVLTALAEALSISIEKVGLRLPLNSKTYTITHQNVKEVDAKIQKQFNLNIVNAISSFNIIVDVLTINPRPQPGSPS